MNLETVRGFMPFSRGIKGKTAEIARKPQLGLSEGLSPKGVIFESPLPTSLQGLLADLHRYDPSATL